MKIIKSSTVNMYMWALCMSTLIIALTSCQSKQSEQENIDILLNQQAEIQDRQESAVNELEILTDSLTREQEFLLEERSNKDQEIKRLESDQAVLVEELNKEETDRISDRKQELESRIKQYNDSVASLKREVELMNESLDSISTNLAVYQVQESRTIEQLESGVAEIDQRMKNREARKQQELKRAELLDKRIDVAEKKMEAYIMERQLYLDEKDELLRANATDEKLAPFEKRISQMDSIIDAEKDIINSLESDQKQAKQFIAETDRVMEELNQQIHEQYNRQEIIESFIISEKDRLQRELELISQTRKNLVEQQAAIATELENINKQMASMDRNINLIKNREMSEILDRQASMEQTEADLANEEISILEEFMGMIVPPSSETSDSLGEDMESLLKLGDEIDSLNALIQVEKTGIAVTQKQLAEQRARVAEQRARLGKAAGLTLFLLILAGAGVLTLFYYMGKRSRKSK